MKKINDVIKTIKARKDRSAWDRGVTAYALDLLEELNESIERGWRTEEDDLCNANLIIKSLLNGASDWKEYSFGGCSLISDSDIAERLCTASELKKTRNGDRNPNSRETWLDVQARALYQACNRICKAFTAK